MFRHLLKLIFGHHRHHCGIVLLAVGLMLFAGSAMACGVAVGSFAVAQPAFVAAPQAVYQSSVGVQCGQQLALAQPQAVYAAPARCRRAVCAAELQLRGPVRRQQPIRFGIRRQRVRRFARRFQRATE